MLAKIKDTEYADAVKLYSQAVEAFPGNPFFKAGSSDAGSQEGESEEVPANEQEGEERVSKLMQGLKVVYFCKLHFQLFVFLCISFKTSVCGIFLLCSSLESFDKTFKTFSINIHLCYSYYEFCSKY